MLSPITENPPPSLATELTGHATSFVTLIRRTIHNLLSSTIYYNLLYITGLGSHYAVDHPFTKVFFADSKINSLATRSVTPQ